MQKADVIVVGLGAMGAATTYQLAKSGVNVIGIDQHNPPHNLGSSHGQSRITRQAIGEGIHFVPLVKRSQELWREIEQGTGLDVFLQCGVLIMNSQNVAGTNHGQGDFLQTTIDAAHQHNIRHELLEGAAISHRFPVLKGTGGAKAYFEEEGGLVRPENAIEAQLILAENLGANLRRNENVISVESFDSGCRVVTDRQTYEADKVVISAGAQVATFLEGLSHKELFKIYRQVLYWFTINPDVAHYYEPENFPTYIWDFANVDHGSFYGFPALDGVGGGLKVAQERYYEDIELVSIDREVHEDEIIATFEEAVVPNLEGITLPLVRAAVCMTTATLNYNFVLDWHPEMKNVFVVSPCSGHGFKHSAGIGEAVSQIIVNGQSEIDLSPFSFDQF